MLRFGLMIFAILALLLADGCNAPKADYSLVDLVKVRGSVTLDGQPLPNAVITFEDPGDDTFSYAMTDRNGKYTLQFDSEMQGVKVGSKVVRISTARKLLGLNVDEGGDDLDDEGNANRSNTAERVPGKYNKQSTLEVTVTQSTTRFDFALESN